ncbi:hypothetical protein VE26_14475 [Devosia chinhatensis]|uniref:Uncharacterized protein n=1 Tax=Devosia chinhatensis TaxID=429727 RepID=A0A0F5FGX9_9HYPH|nr:hypothetical protein VE26_14475 [Devosia chinhatensis]
MMLFRKMAPSPAGFAVDLSPRGEASGARPARQRHLPLRAKGLAAGPGEGAFSEHDCPIWNDIQRALEGASK